MNSLYRGPQREQKRCEGTIHYFSAVEIAGRREFICLCGRLKTIARITGHSGRPITWAYDTNANRNDALN